MQKGLKELQMLKVRLYVLFLVWALHSTEHADNGMG